IKDDPSFEYTISADVTASDGETRSGSAMITLGYAALAIKISCGQDIQADKYFDAAISTETLDGVRIPASKVKLNVWKLKEPQQPVPGKLWSYDWRGDERQEPKDKFSSNWMEWPTDHLSGEREFSTSAEKPESLRLQLPAGLYKLECTTNDKFGKEVRSFLPIMVLPDWDEKRFPIKLPSLVKANDNTIEVGKDLNVLWGTGYQSGRALVEVEHRGKTLKRYWTGKQATQHTFTIPVVEDYRGGFTVRVTQVRENRAYINNLPIFVPWDNKELVITAETFRDKLQPGEKETWKFRIKGKKKEIAAAEMAATLYDFSLDQFYPHSWRKFDFFRREYSAVSSRFANGAQGYNYFNNNWNSYYGYPSISYTHFPYSVLENLFYYGYYRDGGPMDSPRRKSARGDMAMEEKVAPPAPAMAGAQINTGAIQGVMTITGGFKTEYGEAMSGVVNVADKTGEKGEKPKTAKPLDLSGITIRTNLNETAFFFPQLLMEQDGSVSMQFTMPEALTKWKFLGFAHGKECENGLYTGFTVTQKQLMIQPNAPRFLREGDEIYFTAKVTNLSDKQQKGKVQLNLKDLLTDQPIELQLGLKNTTYEFKLAAKTSQGFSWKIIVPKGAKPISYTVAAKSKEFSDGEAGAIPVLTSRIFITESVPLWIRGNQVKKFTFDRLKQIGTSETFDPYKLTVQMSSNPSWYAIQALPYLIEYPYECSEQVFNRLYGNTLAGHIANSSPRIKQVFDQWRGTDALKSNLEKNQQLKSVMLEETPWVLDAQSESQAKRNVGILFEENTLKANLGTAYGKLKAMQLFNGAWPWFPGGRPDPYITLYITTGFARLRHLGAKPDMTMALRAIDYLDNWVRDYYDRIENKNLNHLSPTVAFYLYERSFYLKDREISSHNKVAVDYFLKQAEQYWLSLNSRMSQGYLALALHRFGNSKTAKGIMASIKERSVSSEELGMFWREDELSWWWYRAPIETQALMVEAFDEVMRDTIAVEDCKVWLLKLKQTRDWKTTKATADAVYALILRGDDYLTSDKLVEVKLADMVVTPEKVEAGTGFYEKAYMGDQIKPQYADITVTKQDKGIAPRQARGIAPRQARGIAWGGVHFQYFEDMSKVTPHTTNLSLEKTLFVNNDTKKGIVIEPVSGPLAVGDLVTVRVILRVDRDMEYVHLKDLRGSGLEPTNVFSQYKYQDGLFYYESTRDAATHFFIDYLPKGTYVFEYSLRVQLKGRYQSGIAEIQCMYAPEYGSHSGSVWVEVK
ncbi:MAG: alpha-2-macroglobulin family protein, partial [Candidatus Edwardsbacteria bacterium]|nr:alpha-2-macroglobulin family protein [Candidatus Edwardsbacteria bacterium]